MDLLNEALNNFLSRVMGAAPDIAAGLLVFAGFWVASGIVRRIFGHITGLAEDGRKDIINLAADISRYGILIVGAVAGLGTMGIDVSALVAGLGLTGFALGFALRDAISNMIAGALILTYRPFLRGDRIKVSGYEGLVAAIDLRYTTLEDENKSLRVLVPNATLFAKEVVVYET